MKNACLILLFSLAAASACSFANNPSQPTSTTSVPVNEVDYTAVGASDAIGYGASVVCFPFSPCPDGTGYVPLIQRKLQAAGKTVNLLNLGVPGAVLSPSIETIGNSLNRAIPANFLDGEAPFVMTNSTLVTMFAGPNDVNTIAAAVQAGLGGSDVNGYIQTETQTFGSDLAKLVTSIKSTAPAARIVALNLPNMAALPMSSGLSSSDKHTLQQIAVGFSAQINTMTAKGVIVIDLMCNSSFYDPSIYSSDGFHPNDTGYALIASLIYNVVYAGAASTPSASCSAMTMF